MIITELYFHLHWETLDAQKSLTELTEERIYRYLNRKAKQLGAVVYALNGIEDHVHIVVKLPPLIAVSRFVGQIKGYSATKFNKVRPPEIPPFYWAKGYAVYSCGRSGLPPIIRYVKYQKEYHKTHRLKRHLEPARFAVVSE